MAKQVVGPRYHKIQFEPWAGGPSSPISVNVPRKCLALHPSAVGPGGGSTGTAPVVDKDPSARDRRKLKSPGKATAAARQEQQQQQVEEEEEEEGGGDVGGVGALSPPASSMKAYPAGTTVVVRSVETDPGRTLKFARGETNQAKFEAVLGREVS